MSNTVKPCAECEYLKCIAISRKMYYCNNDDRVDDMGKLGENELPKDNPLWCPLRKETLC